MYYLILPIINIYLRPSLKISQSRPCGGGGQGSEDVEEDASYLNIGRETFSEEKLEKLFYYLSVYIYA